ncbi:hypothetical protein [Schaalia sp. lx-100]|uniref:hypothetical protein n=1 Tax=Schaalia sp. lx-100 TaxID=2899081 RepID=UPI001E5937FB|nr:hypothetical protein [Schaalia sp. lx-100]MCD4557889.1 hypothetical protein [Schaalia sp. lx-100]
MSTAFGFSTYVFVERVSSNAAVLHPFPEHNVYAVVKALKDAGIPVRPFGTHMPTYGEAIYFQDTPFDDEFLGVIADSLTLRGIGAYAYSLIEESIGEDDVHLFVRSGQIWPRAGSHVVFTRLHIGDTADGPMARTWIFGASSDLELLAPVLRESFDTEPVSDPSGMVAIELRHPEFSMGLQRPEELMDRVLQVLGSQDFEGPAFCDYAGNVL